MNGCPSNSEIDGDSTRPTTTVAYFQPSRPTQMSRPPYAARLFHLRGSAQEDPKLSPHLCSHGSIQLVIHFQVHVVDGSSQQPELEFDAVRLELELFSPEIVDKPYVVAFNKMDLPEAVENWPSFKKVLQARGIESFCMSAVTREGTYEVICAAYELLRKSKGANKGFEDWTDPVNLDHVADMVQKQRRAPINDFEISYDSGSTTWHVVGSGLQRFVQMTNWRYKDSERRFQHVLEARGVNKSLMKLGVKEGDIVIVGEMEMVWHDSPESVGLSNMNKGLVNSTKWPEWN